MEAFFTTKGKDLFCIIPSYRPQVILRNFKIVSGASVNILGCNKLLKIKQVGQDAIIDLSALKPVDVPSELFVVQIKNAL
ncbi:MAG: hypothetical protein Q7T76_13215 [Ferruginibacter sp.]|nr:hypothetical protein [Ferruginibacter sp.]